MSIYNVSMVAEQEQENRMFPTYIVYMDAEQKQENGVFPTLSRFHILASAASRKDKLVVS